MAELDEFERRILIALQQDGRLSNQDLADRVGLSASPCWRRVRSLEERGIIRRYAALVDPQAVGLSESVFAAITLRRHTETEVDDFEAAVRQRPEVLECFAITGDADYLLRIVVPSMAAYHRFLHDVLFRLPGVAQVKSSVTLREVKCETALSIAPINGQMPD